MHCVVNYASNAEKTVLWLREEMSKMLLSRGCTSSMVSDTVKRIRLITADLKKTRDEAGTYAKDFFLDTEESAREADVLVCTYAAEAGMSMPSQYFQAVFGMLYPGVGTWDSQFQSSNRVRDSVFTMACIPKENASSVGPVRSGAAVSRQIAHLYADQKPGPLSHCDDSVQS